MRLDPIFPRNLNGEVAIEYNVPAALAIRLPTPLISLVPNLVTCSSVVVAISVILLAIAPPTSIIVPPRVAMISTVPPIASPTPSITPLATEPSPANKLPSPLPIPSVILPIAFPAPSTILKTDLVTPTKPSPITLIPALAASLVTSRAVPISSIPISGILSKVFPTDLAASQTVVATPTTASFTPPMTFHIPFQIFLEVSKRILNGLVIRFPTNLIGLKIISNTTPRIFPRIPLRSRLFEPVRSSEDVPAMVSKSLLLL